MLKGEEGQIVLELPVQVGDQCSIQFIHSVNKTPVIDFYEIREDHIYVVSTLYYSFGAGVQTEVIEGQTLTYTEDGGMLVSGFNQAIPNLAYVVGKVSDHILEYNNEKFSLREICGSGAYVTFELK